MRRGDTEVISGVYAVNVMARNEFSSQDEDMMAQQIGKRVKRRIDKAWKGINNHA